MALISSGSISEGLSGRRRLSESDWTKLLLRHGYAELGASEERAQTQVGSGAAASIREDAPAGRPPRRPTAPEPPDHSAQPYRELSPERRLSLSDMAHKLTGKRKRKT